MPDLSLPPVPAPEAFWARRHRCPHCRRSRANRASAVAHMVRCWSSPAVQACRTCARFVPAEGGYGDDPGTPEHCHAGVELTGAMVTGCQFWESTTLPPRDDHER
jgi:hypothetical protein